MLHDNLTDRNAVELGWHVGYLSFVLTIIGKNDGTELTDDYAQVLGVVKDRLDNLLAFFELGYDVRYPKSPAEARSLLDDSGSKVGLGIGADLYDALRIRKGSDVSSLFSLGQQLMTYSLS